MRRIKGKDWGLSQGLLTITYKVLIRSLLEYAPVMTINMSDNTIIRLEAIQRKASGIIIGAPPMSRLRDLPELLGLDPLISRAYNLMSSYLKKAYTNHGLIKDIIDNYNRAAPIIDADHSKTRRLTTLGLIKSKDLPELAEILKDVLPHEEIIILSD